MGTIRFAGVIFQVYPNDHLPRHVHGRYGGIEVVVELTRDGVRQARRKNAVVPPDAKRSDVSYILKAAEREVGALNRLWEEFYDA